MNADAIGVLHGPGSVDKAMAKASPKKKATPKHFCYWREGKALGRLATAAPHYNSRPTPQ